MNLHDRDIMRAARRDGLAAGIIQGAAEKAIEAARNFWANGVSQKIIAKSLDMPLSKVSEILGQDYKVLPNKVTETLSSIQS